jgi:hypothetical protein
MNRNFHVRKTCRNLPHWQRDDASAIYWITFRLADSLPQEELEKLDRIRDQFLATHPKPWDDPTWNHYHQIFSERIDEWLDAGHGSCILAEMEFRRHVIEALLRFDGERHDFIAGVIMPNHVHLLLRLRTGTELSALLKGIKGTSARHINLSRETTGGVVWMEESYDHIVRSKAELNHCRNYIRENPAKLRPGTFWLEEREIGFKLVSDPLHEVLYALDE